MLPPDARERIRAYDLPPDEEACLLECDVQRRSYAQVCRALCLTPETLRRTRHRAYARITGVG